MRSILAMGLIIIGTRLQAYSQSPRDSVTVDKRKVEKLIKKIKKRPELKNGKISIKNFDRRKLTFSYPTKFLRKRGFEINVLYNEEIILMYDIKTDTYELGEIVDLR